MGQGEVASRHDVIQQGVVAPLSRQTQGQWHHLDQRHLPQYFSVANCLTELGYKILNVITWQKTNPPANISCRFFTYSTEFVIWARKMQKVPHKFNYELMKRLNDGKQMTDVWRMPAIGRWERPAASTLRRSRCASWSA